MKTNWKKLVNPDYLGAYSLDDGNGKYMDILATIKFVKTEDVISPEGKHESCAVAHFCENLKPMILNVTNMKMLEKLTKSKYIEDWADRKIQIGVEKVRAFGDVVDALRIKKSITITSGSGNAPKCTDCGADIQPVGNRSAAAIAEYTAKKYGRPLCGECASKANAAADPLGGQEPEESAPVAITEEPLTVDEPTYGDEVEEL